MSPGQLPPEVLVQQALTLILTMGRLDLRLDWEPAMMPRVALPLGQNGCEPLGPIPGVSRTMERFAKRPRDPVVEEFVW